MLILDPDVTFSSDEERDLYTVVGISLLCRGRAKDGDVLPDATDRGGWWGDAYPDVEGDVFGSRLWTLQGRPMSEAVELAPAIVKEALQWGVEDGVWLSVDVPRDVVGPGVLALYVQPQLPSGKIVDALGPWYLSV